MPEGISEGKRAPDFRLETLAGGEVSLSDHHGDVVLINFWATWCAPCRAEIPAIEAVHQARQNDGFVVFGVNYQESRDVVEPFARELAISYPVLLDERFEVGGQYNGGELPTTVIIDSQGNVRRRFIGARSLAVFEAMVREAGRR